MSDERLEERIRGARAPGERESEERAWELARAAFEARTPRRPRTRLPRLAAATAAGAAVLLLALTPAGADVREFVDDLFAPDRERARPTLTSLPAPGRLLVTSEQGAWVVQEDGSKRLLGDYSEATWSPNGLYVAAVADRQLVALEPDGGTVRWTVSRPLGVSDPRWSPSGYRVAYRSRGELRVLAGDGTDDRLLAGGVAPVAAAWQPVTKAVSPSGAGTHRLAFVTGSGRIELRDADTGERLWRTAPGPDPTEITWSSDGRRLFVLDRRGYRIFSDDGAPVDAFAGNSPSRDAAAYRPGSTSVALATTLGGGASTGVALDRFEGPGAGIEPLLDVPGRVTGLVWSPDGEWLLAAWRDGDQWLFIRPRGGPRSRSRISRPAIDAVGSIGRVFDPGATSSARFPRVEGWCCP
jgi:hypothetical protein